MVKIISYRGLVKYFLSNSRFLYGALLDLIALPFALLMIVVKLVWSSPLDLFYSNRVCDKTPILLIHGSGSNEAQWLPARFYLAHKFDIYSVQLNTLPKAADHSILDCISIIHDKITEIKTKNNNSVILMGHSMGGLVAIKYAELYPASIKCVITISSPLHGAPALEYISFGTKRHNEMCSNSEFLCGIKYNPDLQYIHFGSKYDFQVPHTHSMRQHSNSLNIYYSAGHISAVLFPYIFRVITELH